MITVKLDYPLEVEGQETITELKFGRIKGKHIKKLPKSIFSGEGIDPADFFKMIEILTGISPEASDEIDASEIDKISEELSPLLEEFQPTGKT